MPRIVLPGLPHHITQRGDNRQSVFFTPDDRTAYLDFLREEADRHGLKTLAYCLMTNHVHLVAVPPSAQALARAVGRTHWLYTRYVNRHHRCSGHLWQNRFYSCPLDEPHTHHACAYVERNPVRAKLVRLAWNFPWSSAAAHVGEAAPHPALDIPTWKSLVESRRWRNELQRQQDELFITALQTQTRHGRPLTSDSFLAKLEHRLNRRLRPRPPLRSRRPRITRLCPCWTCRVHYARDNVIQPPDSPLRALFIENCSFFILHSPEPTGQPAQFQAYSAFGEPIPLLTDPATPNSRYGYAGAFGYEAGTDADFPYLHVGARYYDPEVGRFLQRDPIGIERGSNTYAYVANDPLTWVDPTGLWTIGIGLEGSLGLAVR